MLKNLYKIKDLKDFRTILDKIDDIDIMSPEADYLLNERILLKNTLYTLISEQVKKITHCDSDLNLSHLFLKHIFSSRRIKAVLYKIPNVNRNLGSVPKIFLDKAKDKQECAKKIFDIFAKYSLLLNYDYENGEEIYFINNCENLETELSEITQKNVKVEYIGHGVNGNGFKVNIEDKNYFYKVFYPHSTFHNEKINYLHGGFIEPAFGMFANQNAKKNQFVKFYMGRIATKYYRDSFMLAEFLECDYTRPPEELRIDYVLIKESELRRFDNLKEGKIVDFGGMIVEKNSELQNPKIRKLVRVILNHINYKHDEMKFSFSWEISDKRLFNLKSFIKKYDRKTYKTALDIIKEHNIIFGEFLKKLYSINKVNKGFCCTKTLAIKDICSTDLDTIREKINEYKVVCKTESKPTNNTFDGYIMLDLYNDSICTIFYDIENNIKRIRFDKQINQNFVTLLEIQRDMIDSIANELPFYMLYSNLID